MPLPLKTNIVEIDSMSTGERWEVDDRAQLARLIGIIMLGQARYAGSIINQLDPYQPVFAPRQLANIAKVRLTVEEPASNPRKGYPRVQRDGLLFELISWVAAHQQSNKKTYSNDPHLKSTSQGLDGLMIELTDDLSAIHQATIFEDKCVKDPASCFRKNVLPGFLKMQKEERGPELVAAATALLERARLDVDAATKAASHILDLELRRYRAAFAVSKKMDNLEKRKKIFKKYPKLKDLKSEQRVGACFITDKKIRLWFDSFAKLVIKEIDAFTTKGNVNV